MQHSLNLIMQSVEILSLSLNLKKYKIKFKSYHRSYSIGLVGQSEAMCRLSRKYF